jgi:hypothetical protein
MLIIEYQNGRFMLLIWFDWHLSERSHTVFKLGSWTAKLVSEILDMCSLMYTTGVLT